MYKSRSPAIPHPRILCVVLSISGRIPSVNNIPLTRTYTAVN
jgi:hypothetical protein